MGKREKKELEVREKIEEELDREQDTWEHAKTWTKDQERRSLVKQMVDNRELGKRREEDVRPDTGAEGAPRKKLKYGLLREDWGEAPKPREQDNPNTVGSRSLGGEQVHSSRVKGAPARSPRTIPTTHNTTHPIFIEESCCAIKNRMCAKDLSSICSLVADLLQFLV